MVIDSMTKNLVVGDLTYPRQILRGQSYVANLRPNEMVLIQNKPSPVWRCRWAKPKIQPINLLFWSILVISRRAKQPCYSPFRSAFFVLRVQCSSPNIVWAKAFLELK
jgi:hypothetical protein